MVKISLTDSNKAKAKEIAHELISVLDQQVINEIANYTSNQTKADLMLDEVYKQVKFFIS